MLEPIHAVFGDGAFYPIEPCTLPEETKVVVHVGEAGPRIMPPLEPDPEERKRLLSELTTRMKNDPLPAGAPAMPLGREWFYERG
jgi:hypothetical protein